MSGLILDAPVKKALIRAKKQKASLKSPGVWRNAAYGLITKSSFFEQDTSQRNGVFAGLKEMIAVFLRHCIMKQNR
ncbi:MAG: hypothetical protein C0408_03100 [Odoribacter sp.]|nr:hypothetical protein [Odoribacter sp.]